MTISKENEWLSQTEATNSKTAIFIGEISHNKLFQESKTFPAGILLIGNHDGSDLLNISKSITILSESEDDEKLTSAIQSFIRIDQDHVPAIKISHIKDLKNANRFLGIVEITHSIIDSTLRVRKTRRETGFLRQNNILNNLNHYLKKRIPLEWKNCARGSIAVVIGAGPSLDSTLKCLKKIDNPLIVCTDSGLSSLEKIGILPQFVINIDPEKNFEQCTHQDFTPGTLILSSQSHQSWISNWNGCKRFISGRVVSEDWLSEKGVGKTPVLAESNVGLSAISFANFLGPSAIILFGMDLSCGGKGEKRYAKITGRQNIEVNASFYHKIPGNFQDTVPTPFLSDWQETSKACLNISQDRPIINLNDRGAKLEGTDILNPEDFDDIIVTLEENFSPFNKDDEIFTAKRGISLLALNQISFELARLCDNVWSKIQGVSTNNIEVFRDLFADKEIASLLGDFSFSAFQVLLSDRKIENWKIQQLDQELRILIWRLEDAIISINPSEDFMIDFLMGDKFTR